MRLRVPITGTVLSTAPLTGDNDDPIRPVPIDLGHVSWELVDVDLEEEVMTIEVQPATEVSEETGEIDDGGNPVTRLRPATAEEKEGFLQYARDVVEGHTREELYVISGSPKLKRAKEVA